MTRIPSIGVLAVVFLLAGGVSARAADKSEVLSPVVKEALDGLSAEDYGVREKALQQLEVALGRQLQAMVSLDDPESQTRLSALLEFNEGLTHWAIDTLKLPDEQRKTQLKWGLAPEMVATVAKAYSSNADRRLEAAKELAKLEGEEPALLVAHLLNDPVACGFRRGDGGRLGSQAERSDHRCAVATSGGSGHDHVCAADDRGRAQYCISRPGGREQQQFCLRQQLSAGDAGQWDRHRRIDSFEGAAGDGETQGIVYQSGNGHDEGQQSQSRVDVHGAE